MDPQQPQQPQSRPEQPPQQGSWNQAPPPQQPGWAPPPQQQAAGWGQGSYGAPRPARPVAVTLTGIFYIIVGVLAGLAGLIATVLGGAIGGLDLEEFGQFGGFFGGAIVVVGVIILVVAVLFLASGIGILAGKNWARVLGIVLGVIFAVFGLLGILGSMGAGMDAGTMVWNVLFTVLYALAAWVLIKAGPYFAYRG
ncbi:hypothetical protein BH24CHL6_BH24CHL6_13810 [soil metagenome]